MPTKYFNDKKFRIYSASMLEQLHNHNSKATQNAYRLNPFTIKKYDSTS